MRIRLQIKMYKKECLQMQLSITFYVIYNMQASNIDVVARGKWKLQISKVRGVLGGVLGVSLEEEE